MRRRRRRRQQLRGRIVYKSYATCWRSNWQVKEKKPKHLSSICKEWSLSSKKWGLSLNILLLFTLGSTSAAAAACCLIPPNLSLSLSLSSRFQPEWDFDDIFPGIKKACPAARWWRVKSHCQEEEEEEIIKTNKTDKDTMCSSYSSFSFKKKMLAAAVVVGRPAPTRLLTW